MTARPYALDRIVTICASRDAVFRYFTDSAHWARWWGAGSTIDPTVGGRLFIRYPNGVTFPGAIRTIV